MGSEQRRNIARYRAAQDLLDRCADLCVILWNRELPSHADGLRRRLAWLVVALAEGRVDAARAEARSVELDLEVVLRRLGVRRELLAAFDALATTQEALAPPRDTAQPTIHYVPPLGDWTTAVWKVEAG